MTFETYTTLLELKSKYLSEIVRLQQGGVAVEQPRLPFEPNETDYISDVTPTLDEVLPLPEATKESKPKIDSLQQVLNSDFKISVDEAISEAERSERKSEAPQQQEQQKQEAKPSRFEHFKMWQREHFAWKLERNRLTYEYNRTCQDVKKNISGLLFAIDIIDRTIASEQRKITQDVSFKQ